MKNDFCPIICKLPEAETIRILPIADVHYGSLSHNEREWNKFLKWINEQENTYIVLAGDLINNNTRSSVGSPWDDTVRPSEQKREMARMLAPIKDKILCLVPGNHERRSLKDADDEPTLDIASKLDIEDVYRPNMAFLKVLIGERNTAKNKGKQCYTFCVTHGAGGGILTGGMVNRNERFAYALENVDCLIVGHSHKGAITKPARLVFDAQNNKVSTKPFTVVACTAWQNYQGYPMQKMMLPAETSNIEGGQVIYLSGTQGDKRLRVLW